MKHDSYEFFDHAADVGIRIRAGSRAALFRLAAEALMDWIGRPPESPVKVRRAVSLEAEDQEQLLVRWLQELIFLFQQGHIYTTAVPRLRLTEKQLEAEITGVRWGEGSAQDLREVKAVTYHQLRVAREGGIWRGNVILDV